MGDRRQDHPQSLSTSSTSLPYITNIFTLLLLYIPSIARPDLSIEAPWGLSSRQYIYTARLIAALKPHGACPLGTLYISWQQSRDSLVITDPTTNPPVGGLTMGERTGSSSASTVTCRNCEKQGHFSKGNSRSQH
ncbi:hypothetical protein DER44DRAFT_1987 [Fusarium oxysporum]|nr:hypothetical protein DER44DRAFT_1987 [Fusarium oxysporum]